MKVMSVRNAKSTGCVLCHREVQKEALGCFPFPQGAQCSSSSCHTCRTYL